MFVKIQNKIKNLSQLLDKSLLLLELFSWNHIITSDFYMRGNTLSLYAVSTAKVILRVRILN